MIPCKTCDIGELHKRKRYRMSGVVVFIGYILLVPSAIGMLIGLIGMFATSKASETTFQQISSEARVTLEQGGVPDRLIERVIAMQPVSAADTRSLTPEQQRLVEAVEIQVLGSSAGAGIGVGVAGGFSAATIVMSLVGGLLGWLLVMKKKVLQCMNCGAVTAAS